MIDDSKAKANLIPSNITHASPAKTDKYQTCLGIPCTLYHALVVIVTTIAVEKN